MRIPGDPFTRFASARLLIAFAFWGALSAVAADAPRTAWFIDGFHGGVHGHYPADYTGFLIEQLKKHPEWKINLEIEPETWDVVRVSEPEAYAAFKAIMEDPSDAGRIEIVNPAFAQSYLFQCSGESVIRQFDYGIRKLREHFRNAVFTTYSSEEPCFTSCLPPVLKSFGFQFAVLKNPDTCWGGYTLAYGGELVNWIGPDGTPILTVPRYASESLQDNSCWQTIAFHNSPEYLATCRAQGIEHPVGMCLQDAGWRGGPWLGAAEQNRDNPSKYVTWRDYFRNVTPGKTHDDWHFSQEDVKPGLMWGAQVLQRIAQQSREAEHRLLVAEKLTARRGLAVSTMPGTTCCFPSITIAGSFPTTGASETPGSTRCGGGRRSRTRSATSPCKRPSRRCSLAEKVAVGASCACSIRPARPSTPWCQCRSRKRTNPREWSRSMPTEVAPPRR